MLDVLIKSFTSKPNEPGDKKAAQATRTADIPPIELRAATIWGISVIATLFDKYVPIKPPIEIPDIISNQFIRLFWSRFTIVTINAIAIPDIPR